MHVAYSKSVQILSKFTCQMLARLVRDSVLNLNIPGSSRKSEEISDLQRRL